MANFLPPAIIEIKALADKAIAEFKQVNGELDKMEKEADKAGGGISRMEKTSKLATGALIGMGAAFAGFAAIGIKEAMEAEVIMTKLGATMAAVGVNSAKNREEVSKLAESYIQLGFADDAAAAGLEVLLRVTGDLDKAQSLLALSADLARTKNIGLAEASSILAKASTGNAKAFKDAGIALDTTLPKAEAIDKAFKELNDRIGSQAENATKTFAVQLQIVKEQFSNTAETLGASLLPMLKTLLERINSAVEFVKRNSAVFKILAGVVITVTVALAAYNAGVKVSIALTKIQTGLLTAQKIATALLTGNQLALNAAMKANPIGLVFTAVTLLIGGFVMLWNKSEAFRKIVITMAKAALTAFASIIPIVGRVYEAILKIVSTPLRLLLSALSKLPGVGKYAKSGLDLINKGLEGVSDFADSASKKAKELAANLDKLNKPIKFGGKGIEIPELDNKGGKGKKGGGLDPKEKAALEKKNAEYLKIVKDLNEKVESAQKKYNETIAKAQKQHDESVAKAHEKYRETELAARTKHSEDILKAERKRDESIYKAEENARKKRIEAQTAFNNIMGKLNAKRAEDLAKLEKDNANKVQSIYKANAEKLQSIVEQSVNRLRDAYKSGTSFSVTELFKGLVDAGKRTADELLSALKNKLDGARRLAKNASQLAGLGFSQTFIEQITSAGPEVGNELADSILKATPETIRELQNTFISMERQTNTGLDHLATAMNKGANLATDELNKAYREAEKDLTLFLAEQAQEYSAAQVEINKEFTEQMADAERTRDEALASAEADLIATLAEINKEFIESTAEINKQLNDTLAEANKDLNNALMEAAKDLTEATDQARKELSETLDEIAKEFDEKLGKIKGAIASTMAAIAALRAAIASAQTAAASAASSASSSAKGTTTITTSPSGVTSKTTSTTATTTRAVPADGSIASFRAGEEKSMAGLTINQTFNTDYVDPIQVKTQMLNAIKYGSTVETTKQVYSAMHTAAMRAR
jgi:hypothetical protein